MFYDVPYSACTILSVYYLAKHSVTKVVNNTYDTCFGCCINIIYPNVHLIATGGTGYDEDV